MPATLDIEFLWFEGCPNHNVARLLLREALAETGLESVIREVEVHDDAEAQALHFVGSPSIRVNGRDVDADGDAAPYGMACRVYATAVGPRGNLDKAMIVRALRAADGLKAERRAT